MHVLVLFIYVIGVALLVVWFLFIAETIDIFRVPLIPKSRVLLYRLLVAVLYLLPFVFAYHYNLSWEAFKRENWNTSIYFAVIPIIYCAVLAFPCFQVFKFVKSKTP